MLLQAEYDALFQLLSSLPSSLPDHPSTSNLPPQIDLKFTAEEGACPAQILSSEHNFMVSINWNTISLVSVHTFANTLGDNDYRLMKARPELKTSYHSSSIPSPQFIHA
ncbi:hypothetical protein M422DRAFT_275566 [Sphaerobolus stellatus SS14]|uniref:Uncharacterized protein n=1 Tax=Sphaerobolus stellatus (strain SS14) TaxID=990650 RepID=A0A0C9UF15_SPHS4|nr:hypothetical protein M422DRAFT_275566 [Sphaerobolus stellatus SS14]